MFFFLFVFTFRGFYHHHKVLTVGAEMETVHSGFTLKLRHRGRSSEVRDQSFLFISLLLSFSLFSPSLSLSFSLSCRSSSSVIGAVQSADSPFMADGGRGSGGVGLLECWHVPIRATVLHYSISVREHGGQGLVLYLDWSFHNNIDTLLVPPGGPTRSLLRQNKKLLHSYIYIYYTLYQNIL